MPKIRFITPRYEELFKIEDGEEIRIIYPDGDSITRVCEFMDETHLKVGGYVYHICEFAEKMKLAGNKVEPSKKM